MNENYLMKNIVKKIVKHDDSFLHQLTVSFTIGITTLILAASIVTSWLASNRTESSLVKQGHQITENLARQSMLALLYGEGENAKDAAQGALAFPDVLSVYIYDTSFQLILHEGEDLEQEIVAFSLPMTSSTLVLDKKTHWRFRAPVYSQIVQDDEFVIQDANAKPELLGYTDIVLSKDTLVHTITSIFFINSIIFFALAAVLLVLLRIMAKRLTRPLNELSNTMYNAETSVENVYADEHGPQEVKMIAHAFNQMIGAINERDRKLRGQNITLEKRVKERTVELAEARDKAIEASKTKSSFLANMSHELRTPLNAIIGYSEILMEDAISEKNESIYADLHKVNGAGIHLLSLINDILDLSKIEAGKMDLYVEDFSIKSMLSDVQSVVEPLAQKNSNSFHIVCPENIGTMCSDITKIRQSLLNLISNACKFTKNGEVSLVVSPHNIGNSECISFCVSDQGIGMSKKQINNLFKEFSQADSSTTRKYGGTGLGLAISRRFCEMMGGDITVNSIEGEGSAFTMILPRNAPMEGVLLPREEVRKQKDRRKRKIRVAILDADRERLSSMQTILNDKGFDVSKNAFTDEGINWYSDTTVINILSDELDSHLNDLSLFISPHIRPIILTAQVGTSEPGMAIRSLIVGKSDLYDHDVWLNMCNYLQNNELRDVVVITSDAQWFDCLTNTVTDDGFRLIRTDVNDIDSILARISPSMIVFDSSTEHLLSNSSLMAIAEVNRKDNAIFVWAYSEASMIDALRSIRERVHDSISEIGMSPDEFKATLTELVSNDMRLR